jgi:GNAT superfamily N-acetyltransferase
MSPMDTSFSLRDMVATDGPAIAALGEQTPDTGAVAFQSQFHYDPFACLLALRPSTVGVVAEAPDGDGLAGMGLMSFGDFQYQGAVRPFAYLYSLSVHPRYRRIGLASQIGARRVELARERFGEDGVVLAGIQGGNIGSLRVANTWSHQRVDRTQAAIAKMRARPPKPLLSLAVRPAGPADLEEIATKQNAFYASYNMYPPSTARSLAEWRGQVPLGFEIHQHVVASDRQGNLVAGLAMTEEGRLLSTRVVRMPLPLRLADVFLKIMPPGGVVRRLHLDSIWFSPGQEAAVTFLWESVRWLARDRGTTLMTFFDPNGPIARVIPQSRLIPRQVGSLVIRAPVPLDEDRLIYLLV